MVPSTKYGAPKTQRKRERLILSSGLAADSSALFSSEGFISFKSACASPSVKDRDQPLQFFSSKNVFLLTEFTGDFGGLFVCDKFFDLVPTQSEQSPLDPFLAAVAAKSELSFLEKSNGHTRKNALE